MGLVYWSRVNHNGLALVLRVADAGLNEFEHGSILAFTGKGPVRKAFHWPRVAELNQQSVHCKRAISLL